MMLVTITNLPTSPIRDTPSLAFKSPFFGLIMGRQAFILTFYIQEAASRGPTLASPDFSYAYGTLFQCFCFHCSFSLIFHLFQLAGHTKTFHLTFIFFVSSLQGGFRLNSRNRIVSIELSSGQVISFTRYSFRLCPAGFRFCRHPLRTCAN